MRESRSTTGSKLPTKQLAILAVARFAEPLALTSVFPYLPEMILSFGVKQEKVAQWAGLTGAAFSIAQSLTAVPWGMLSDRIGRKPTIMIGLMSTMICFLVWGMSTSLAMALTVRFVQGAGNGNVGIIRTMVAEMVPEREHQARAFSIMPLVWSLGSIFGPSFGGFFARPAQQYPGLFGDSVFFNKYPFALPNFVACVFFMISFITGILFLEETLESKRHVRDWGLKLGEKLTRPFFKRHHSHHHRHARPSFVDGEATAPLLPRSPARSVRRHSRNPPPKRNLWDLFNFLTVMNLLCYTFLAMHAVAFDQLLPVYLNYPHREPGSDKIQLPFKFKSGFGLSFDKIGAIFMLYGIICGVIQFVVFPPLCNKYGALRCYQLSAILFPIAYILTPYTSLVPGEYGRFLALMAVLTLKGFAGILGFPCVTIMLTNSAPSLSILGTLNGVATTLSGVGRAVGPAAGGAVFTWGVNGREYIVSGFWFLAAVAVLGAIPPWFMTEEPEVKMADSESSGSDSDEDEVEEEDDTASLAVYCEAPRQPADSGSRGYGTVR
ncbi:hypothetical protein GGTG_08347 [Gaeumannomyces tritici R3-111a-1]|uniref:Major facilitator superfamily (MFS) profile domain-containing protein n=1 Tax=Gaeumannomyces tritici (strain R3-111a-1) TaxID=644352 RepID=J3P4B1_GAET3|nr:hypothetical protein GGTG_08347 [Gaeumannomyces tritici R3-111a-1]EJT74507.1 hypothetical protein GGTG_08347 [Gaeumannomyces tritici R3-111a-1]